jgi:hypothetical protein
LELGQRASVAVAARPKWNATGVTLERDATYLLTAAGEWFDWVMRTDPGGYRSNNRFLRMTEKARRVPSAPWFALIGAIDRDHATQFAVGRGREYQPPRTGELTCFANDVSLAYCNDRGSITLTIERIT